MHQFAHGTPSYVLKRKVAVPQYLHDPGMLSSSADQCILRRDPIYQEKKFAVTSLLTITITRNSPWRGNFGLNQYCQAWCFTSEHRDSIMHRMQQSLHLLQEARVPVTET